MYSTCLFCNANLGSNEVVEHFPVGRRLAFDAAKGRLWVVCRSCERWCLSPLEERWEAIEECERLFRDTRLRVSTENMGLARLREGLELVRVGEPMRPEMAAWRYGDQFGRRRKRALLRAGLGLGALGAAAAGGIAVGIGVAGLWNIGQFAAWSAAKGSSHTVVARIAEQDQETLLVRRKHLAHARLKSSSSDGEFRLTLDVGGGPMRFHGADAVRVAGYLLPPLNRFGGRRGHVDAAVGLLEAAGDPIRYFAATARRSINNLTFINRIAASPESDRICMMPYPIRLALEMAAHEESERRAIEGELAHLQVAWRQAEEIAAIADSLLLPAGVEESIQRIRG